MESLPNENGGCKVYRRKRKIPSSSEGSNPEEAIPMNSKNTKGKAKSHIPPCVVVQGNEVSFSFAFNFFFVTLCLLTINGI